MAPPDSLEANSPITHTHLLLGQMFGGTDFSRTSIFEPPDFSADLVAGFSPHFGGRKRNPNPNFLVWISSGGAGVFHVKGWVPKSSVCASKPRETRLFGGISGMLPGYPAKSPKSLRKIKKQLCSILVPYNFVGKVHPKNPPGKSSAKSSKICTARIPDTFLQRGRANCYEKESRGDKRAPFKRAL